ncbi:hypothetical protein GE061_009493 [Apolygus lucorum]|uniref:Uncharacterized protein n=1 Tax=Apolygus lucorum TaxID=248454 RepID=A0A8S9Y0B7_APOLU|nr:hypothetical protein GE061_009493 [Apolygus lucorum]
MMVSPNKPIRCETEPVQELASLVTLDITCKSYDTGVEFGIPAVSSSPEPAAMPLNSEGEASLVPAMSCEHIFTQEESPI